MGHLISATVKIAWLITSYSTIMIHLAGLSGDVLRIFTDLFGTGVPQIVGFVMGCTISTLNWLFTPEGVNLAMTVWLTFPAIKFTLYLTKKFVWVA